MPKHTIVGVDITDSNVWYENRGTFDVTIRLVLSEGNRYKYEAKIKSGNEEIILVPETVFSNNSNITFPIDRNIIKTGSNILTVKITDEIVSEDMTTIFTYDIKGEDRDSFTIERRFDFQSEYLLYNNISIDDTKKLNVTTSGSRGASGIAVNKNAIQMDGRSRINKITVTADDDIYGDSNRIYKYDEYHDRGDNIVTIFNLGDINSFKNIKSIITN